VLSWPQWLAAFGSLGIFLAVALLSGLGALLREALGGQLLGGLPADH